jgi:hypothetical protein
MAWALKVSVERSALTCGIRSIRVLFLSGERIC